MQKTYNLLLKMQFLQGKFLIFQKNFACGATFFIAKFQEKISKTANFDNNFCENPKNTIFRQKITKNLYKKVSGFEF